jgi:hypothetical protein
MRHQPTKRFTQQPLATPFADGPENSNVGLAADASFPVAVRELIVRWSSRGLRLRFGSRAGMLRS